MIGPMKWQVDEVLESIERMERAQEIKSKLEQHRLDRKRLEEIERRCGCEDPE